MAASEKKAIPAVQETTVVPTKDGYAVQIYVSEKPPSDEEAADLRVILRVQIAQKQDRAMTLAGIELAAMNAAFEALKPLMAARY